MPYINVKVAKSTSRKQEQLITSHLGEAMEAILQKSPKGLMVSVESDVHLYLGGEFMEYAAYVEIITASSISKEQSQALYKVIGVILEQDLKVPQDHAYVVFRASDHFGAKGNIL